MKERSAVIGERDHAKSTKKHSRVNCDKKNVVREKKNHAKSKYKITYFYFYGQDC